MSQVHHQKLLVEMDRKVNLLRLLNFYNLFLLSKNFENLCLCIDLVKILLILLLHHVLVAVCLPVLWYYEQKQLIHQFVEVRLVVRGIILKLLHFRNQNYGLRIIYLIIISFFDTNKSTNPQVLNKLNKVKHKLPNMQQGSDRLSTHSFLVIIKLF